MKLTYVFTTLFAAMTMASPTNNLPREITTVDASGNLATTACIECPCPDFWGPCICIANGCCAGHCRNKAPEADVQAAAPVAPVAPAAKRQEDVQDVQVDAATCVE